MRHNQTRKKTTTFRSRSGFTIVELITVIVVIGILSAIVTISYDAVMTESHEDAMKADLQSTYAKLKGYRDKNGEYPAALGGNEVKSDNAVSFNYAQRRAGADFCLKASRSDTTKTYTTTKSGEVVEGDCPADVANIQTITSANCPTTRTLAVDARDNHTYWIQKLADGKCWMLTNLAYAGGGTNTYSDTMPTGDGTSGTLSNGTSDGSGSYTYTSAKYYIPTGANVTTSPTQPSASTDGTGQYGYLYNFCAANAGQSGNGACSDSSSTAVNTSVSICPAGWRLPTGGSSGELKALNTAINSGSTSSPSGLLTTWLAQYGGYWNGGFGNQGSSGYYWSSTQSSSAYAYSLNFSSSGVGPSGNGDEDYGRSVRCVAQ